MSYSDTDQGTAANVFDEDAGQWWSPNSHCALLSGLVQPRLDYLRGVLPWTDGNGYGGISVLDVGCGGGLFAEELARRGFSVTGVDISPRSIDAAKAHARESGLDIEYRVSPGERLPFEDGCFGLVCCCDVLEHVDDVGSVVGQCARVLKEGGVFFFDTINRTWLSKLLMVDIVQDWLGVVPRGLHDWRKFIRPKELSRLMSAHSLQPSAMVGLMPDMGPRVSIRRFGIYRRIKKGTVTYSELGREMVFRPSRFRCMNYMGHAVSKSG
jgi:2-polyprenyl-6-hydroxyphenyl methylase/3-demethylubiquinone-9 3-methyltransferase